MGAELESEMARLERQFATVNEVSSLRAKIARLEERMRVLEQGIYVGERL